MENKTPVDVKVLAISGRSGFTISLNYPSAYPVGEDYYAKIRMHKPDSKNPAGLEMASLLIDDVCRKELCSALAASLDRADIVRLINEMYHILADREDREDTE